MTVPRLEGNVPSAALPQYDPDAGDPASRSRTRIDAGARQPHRQVFERHGIGFDNTADQIQRLTDNYRAYIEWKQDAKRRVAEQAARARLDADLRATLVQRATKAEQLKEQLQSSQTRADRLKRDVDRFSPAGRCVASKHELARDRPMRRLATLLRWRMLG